MKLLKNSHKGRKVNPFQDTDASHPRFIHPDPVAGRFSNKMIFKKHIVVYGKLRHIAKNDSIENKPLGFSFY